MLSESEIRRQRDSLIMRYSVFELAEYRDYAVLCSHVMASWSSHYIKCRVEATWCVSLLFNGEWLCAKESEVEQMWHCWLDPNRVRLTNYMVNSDGD